MERRSSRRVQAVGVCQSTGSASSHEVASGSCVGAPLDPHVAHNMCGRFCSFVGGTIGAVRDMVSHSEAPTVAGLLDDDPR